MKPPIRTATILSAAALAFLAGSGARAAAAPPPPGEEVRAFVNRYIEAHNKGDRDAVAAMLSRQEPVSSIEMGAITRGWESIRSAAGTHMGEAGTHRLAVGSLEVTPLGPEHVLVVAPISIDLAAPEGDTTMQGAMSLVLSKGKSGWLVLHEHASLQFPISDFGGEN
jgi:ketosteroid isomerase-like protein